MEQGGRREESEVDVIMGDSDSIPGSGRSPGDGNATHSSILAWRIPWVEEPGRLQSMGSRRVGYAQATSNFTFTSVKQQILFVRVRKSLSWIGLAENNQFLWISLLLIEESKPSEARK